MIDWKANARMLEAHSINNQIRINSVMNKCYLS